MPDVKRTIKIVTESRISDPNSGIEGFPLRQWSVEIHLLNDHGEPVPASVFPKSKHIITFKNPKPPLLAQLRESGPVPGDENGVKKRSQEESKKKKRVDKNVDMDKLADGLQKLGEDDLLQVVQMVHDNKSSDSYTKNDIEQGEFHVDLYTLPDALIRMLWDFTQEKGVL
ncbi:transcription initiation factor subunit TAF30 [Trichophyton equinum CBS 127.97]|uniref:Transcription initiation factor subunit TAF30 n=1 Tax=Trichophyton equinum (strain ATCC MYA-4606 / CBS 127.97) TaxID=559882 RepID=F2PUN1_TRIEC|nr:transcription initiation factor subunit TAF30 [Trichophyton equinum CBS 127.97]